MRFAFFLLEICLFTCIFGATIQNDAKTNTCPEHLINFNGTCYNEILGCKYYKNGTSCIKCQQGFDLINDQCEISKDNLTQILLLNSAKSSNSDFKGSSNQISLTYSDQSNFNKIRSIVASKYSSTLTDQNEPVIMSILKSSFETIFSFTWTTVKNKTFLFQYQIDFEGTSTELIADEFDQNLENSLFSKINSKLIDKYNTKLTEATLTKVASVSKNLYKLHFYSDFGIHYVAFVQKIPYLEIKPLETLPWRYDEKQIMNFVCSQHPFLVSQPSYNIQKREDTKNPQYEITFKSQTKVILQQIPFQKIRIVFLHREQNQTLSLYQNSKIVGGYQILKSKEDDILRKVLDHLYNEFTFLKKAEVSKIQYQVVAGTNFLIHLKQPAKPDDYICKVFYSLTGEINILEIYMNSMLIHTQPLAPLQADLGYSFLSDPYFKKVQQYLNSHNITLPEDIMYVNRARKSNDINTFIEYEIVYEENSFIIANFFIEGPRNGQVQIQDFISNGDNQFQYKYNDQNSKRIKEFLEGYRKWVHPLIIEYFKETKPDEYLLKIITEYGSYFFKIVDTKVSGLEIYYYELIDESEHCMTHSIDELHDFQFEQRSLISNLKANYKIDPSAQLVSFSEGVLGAITRTRLLFVHPSNYKKTQIFLRFEDDSYQVDNIQEENNGTYLITDMAVYSKAVQKAYLNLAKDLINGKAILGLMNSKTISLYFALEEQTQQYVYSVSLDVAMTQKPKKDKVFQQQISKPCKKYDSSGNCLQCKQTQISLLSNCYDRIKSCLKQVGRVCLICEQEYTLTDNQCISECAVFM